MKNILQEYIPFEHDNVNYINGLIAFAREKGKSKETENIIASSVIYANLVEYLASHLLKNMRHMMYLLSYFQMNGVLFVKSDEKKSGSKTLGQLKNELENYEFPDKQDFVKLLEKFNTARISLIHKIMDVKNEQEINKVDNDLSEIQAKAEEILQKYNVIIQGIQNAWSINTGVTSNQKQETENE